METLENLAKKLQSYDWYYAYSDDIRVWRRGQAAREEIDELIASLGKEASRPLVERYAPLDFVEGLLS